MILTVRLKSTSKSTDSQKSIVAIQSPTIRKPESFEIMIKVTFNSLTIRLRFKDLKHLIPGNRVHKLQG